jgi:photosystem II stability/assembly factor-like uncharacterized protein
MSFVSDERGFALGTAGCGRERCPAVLGTTDGGRTWTRLGAPDATAPGPDGRCSAEEVPCADEVRFATPLIGYAYDPSLYVTTDGSWSTVLRLPAGLPVILVGYEDPLTGRVAQGDMVWTTRDGGRTWTGDRF